MAFSKKPIRRSQLISPWGVGAIVPFPEDESVMIAGLDLWRFGNDVSGFLIKDERLTKRLGVKELRRPPDFRDNNADRANAYLTIPAVRFPRWLYCPFCGSMKKTELTSGLDKCDGYPWQHGRTCHDSKQKRTMIPERFVVVCPDGHIDDFPIMEWVHDGHDPGTSSCRLRRSTGGVSASLSGVFYECTCGAKRSIAGAMRTGALTRVGYSCSGSKPWFGIEREGENHCGREDVKVVQRGGSNVWFADIRSSIHIAADEDDEESRRLARIVEETLDMVKNNRVNGEINKSFVEGIAKVKHVDPNQLLNVIMMKIDNAHQTSETDAGEISEEKYRLAEYLCLIKNSGGDNQDFHSKNLPIDTFHESIRPFFKSISLVHKLRETRALVGFSRLIPNDALPLSEKKKMLWKKGGDWLPAVEVYGEGVFLEFDKDKLEKWASDKRTIERIGLLESYLTAAQHGNGPNQSTINPMFVLIHTFAHILINQLSYNCGYGSSSIRERIYCDREKTVHDMYGVLLYTASGDSEGSLGGLVRQGVPGRIEDIIISALSNAQWCSSDPVCIQSHGQGPDNCNLAACHNCALLPETCCENGNRLLDRGFMVGTLDDPSIGFFSDMDANYI